MSTKFKPHVHAVAGIKMTIVITLVPPFVTIVPEPIMGLTKETEEANFNDHEHEEISIPSAEISGSTQQLIDNVFTLHSHTEEVFGISAAPVGAFTAFITFMPPPIDLTIGDPIKYLEYQKNHYLEYFYKNIRNRKNINNINNYKELVKNYNNLYGGKLYDKFKNNQ